MLSRLSRAILALAACAALLGGVSGCASTRSSSTGAARPPAAGGWTLNAERLDPVRDLLREAIATKQTPGGVVVVGTRDGVAFREAFGYRSTVPVAEPMTAETLFDLASLTKVVATTPAVMLLVERGRLALDDPVVRFLPELDRYGKHRITVRHLLTHTSGLRAGVELVLPFDGREALLALIAEEVLEAAPGERFIYSDLDFVLLGEIVSRVSGIAFEEFVRTELFDPLGMRDTVFRPDAESRRRAAATEACDPDAAPCPDGPGIPLKGVVHDPMARRVDGVAGHAGLFGTADDLARFCRMVLNGGALDGTRVLAPLSVRLMTQGATPPALPHLRGLGWDVDSSFSSVRGDLLPIGSFGHTGWTGTSLWIDPVTGTFVVLLTNRVHPDGTGDVRELRERIANVVGAALVGTPEPQIRQVGRDFGARALAADSGSETNRAVLTGADVLAADGSELLRNRRVTLLTNHTGRTRTGARTIDVLRAAREVTLVSLLSPEHGIQGTADDRVASGTDAETGLPVHSLYGETRRPTAAMLAGADTVVIDLQDIGARFYTYMTTIGYVLEEAAARGIRVVVLDRPNPVNGYSIEGPVQDDAAEAFTAYFPMPIRHGLTIGELARLFNGEKKIGADLHIVAMRNWSRRLWYDETGLPWVNPSPNMRNLHQAALYPGIGAFEFSNISVGRGTDSPFEQIGAPWIDGVALAAALNARALPGVRFYPVRFTPSASVYAGEPCGGVFMIVTNREALRPVRVGVEIASVLFRLHGSTYEPRETWRLLGSRAQVEALSAGVDPGEIAAGWRLGEARWRLLRARYLLY